MEYILKFKSQSAKNQVVKFFTDSDYFTDEEMVLITNIEDNKKLIDDVDSRPWELHKEAERLEMDNDQYKEWLFSLIKQSFEFLKHTTVKHIYFNI